jgi:hypothetical protein
MKAESCRNWKHSLGAYALGHLQADERAGLEAHLEGCPDCRVEADSLMALGRLLPLADPAHFNNPRPQPAPDLGERIASTIGAERRGVKRRRRRRQFGLALGGVAAATAAVLAILVFPSAESGGPEQHVEFTSLPAGVHIGATLEPHAYGTEIHMYVSGMRSGTLCRVFLRGPHGVRVPAGTFRYRWGDDSQALLSSALDLSRTRAIGVRAGNKTFVAPVDIGSATAEANSNQEDNT